MAGHKYAIQHQTAAGTTLTLLELNSTGTTRRAWIFELGVSSDAAPADVAGEFNVVRGTVSGTGTAVTPVALDGANPAAIFAGEGGTFTGQTITSNSALLNFGLNQRVTYRWIASPDCEMVVPAVNDSWVGIHSIASSGTPNINLYMHFLE